jgi:hypothetical protein
VSRIVAYVDVRHEVLGLPPVVGRVTLTVIKHNGHNLISIKLTRLGEALASPNPLTSVY